jgi:hypothetical protein
MLVFTPFAYCFVTLCGTFMYFPEEVIALVIHKLAWWEQIHTTT